MQLDILNNARLYALQMMLMERLDDVCDKLCVNFRRTAKMMYGSCPVHGGNNSNGFNLYLKGDSVPGYWRCYTKHCEQTFKKTILGFVRGVLSHQKYDWTRLASRAEHDSQRTVSFPETVKWCCQLLETKFDSIPADYKGSEKRAFASSVSVLTRKPFQVASDITRPVVRNFLNIPSDYFVNRGWTPEVLNQYDVGFCGNPASEMAGRIVVPVYDDSGYYLIGCTGRSPHPECKDCGMYHQINRACPHEQERLLWSKWRNTKTLRRESHLYNYWFAKKHIRESGVAALIEGPPDTWRLEEAGIHVGLGMFGNAITDQQQILLETSGATDLVVLTNNDEAGREGAEKIKKKLERSFRLHFPAICTNDLGDMTPDQVRKEYGPIFNSIRQRHIR